VPQGTASKAELRAQREELVALRGDLTQKEWAALLDVPQRTYIRYEMGQREAPGSLMKLARLSTERRPKRKRGT
jgi:DNA-binding XRE family transcriptional regulator